jgi:hypothetical protein
VISCGTYIEHSSVQGKAGHGAERRREKLAGAPSLLARADEVIE